MSKELPTSGCGDAGAKDFEQKYGSPNSCESLEPGMWPPCEGAAPLCSNSAPTPFGCTGGGASAEWVEGNPPDRSIWLELPVAARDGVAGVTGTWTGTPARVAGGVAGIACNAGIRIG